MKTEILNIGDKGETYDPKFNEWRESEIISIRNDVPCCEGTDNAHIHEVLLDVKFSDRISKGHFPSAFRRN